MAQGAIKKAAKPNPGLNKSGSGKTQTKKGISKPQRAKNKSTADRLQKKYTSGMVAQTEVLLGARAGHLELIGKGRKKALADGSLKVVKGGTRKFG
ncbi:hypothetical protein QBC47DRAFT_384641 [Echria macrotheca]|uniref:Uncharacterized protein n=1 Tax=Echria macrotheca TaxID=438768 RepID=A0AAJ0BAH8_9PEZI|nr:hypothetical protein QBC47DRAFT_384641 [Echria macrotheca]